MTSSFRVSLRFAVVVFGFLALLSLSAGAHADNIIGVANNATSCGGSTIRSTNGTHGYLINGTGVAFDLSTITSWFQIDTDGTSHITGQLVEPDGGAGNFLVINDTGKIVTSLSLTITDTITLATPGQRRPGQSEGVEVVCGATMNLKVLAWFPRTAVALRVLHTVEQTRPTSPAIP